MGAKTVFGAIPKTVAGSGTRDRQKTVDLDDGISTFQKAMHWNDWLGIAPAPQVMTMTV